MRYTSSSPSRRQESDVFDFLTQDVQSTFEISNLNTDTMAGANEAELREVFYLAALNVSAVFLIISPQAFKLFDADGDGLISAEELKSLISKVKKS